MKKNEMAYGLISKKRYSYRYTEHYIKYDSPYN